MAKTQTPLLWTLLLLSLACLGLGAFALRAEAGASSLGSGSSQLPQFLSMMDEAPPLPLSVEGQRAWLRNCEVALQAAAPLALRFASDRQKAAVLPFCANLAQASVAADKTDAYAWLVLATTQIRQGEMDAASQSIVWSALTGHNESWLAQIRFDLVQNNYAALSASAQSAGDADTAILVQSNRGAAVARQYVADADFRRRAEQLIEALPETVQRRFISLIRRQL